MNTFDAIAHIRREALSHADAMRYLMEKLGFSATYADEVVAVISHPVEQVCRPASQRQTATAK